jgi:TatD DNase family protein
VNLTDSHCHLDDGQFAQDQAEVIARACAAGVKYMLAIGTGNGPPDLEVALRVADEYPSVFATVGIHPNDSGKLARSSDGSEDTFKDLERLLMHPKVKAMGEVGLDYHWGVPKETQLPVFERQLEIAAAARLPVVIHTRDAWEDTLAVLRTQWAPTKLPCILHCFTGTTRQANECLELGFFLGFGGVSTFPKAIDLREAARIVPSDRLLLETDAPYLAPVPYRGKRNEPAFVAHTARAIAAVREIAVEDLASQTTANFERIIGLEQLN